MSYRKFSDTFVDWDLLAQHAGDNRVVRHVKFSVDRLLTVEELEIVDPYAAGVAPWLQGKVRCRLLRTSNGNVLWDSGEFMVAATAHRLLGRASKAQRQIDEAKGIDDAV